MKSLQVTQEQLHVLEQFLAADLPAATPGECVAWRKALLQADAAIAKVAKFQQWPFLVELEALSNPLIQRWSNFY